MSRLGTVISLLGLSLLLSCSREPLSVPEGEGRPILFSVGEVQVSSTKAEDLSDAPTKEDYLISDGNKVGVFATWESSTGEKTDVFSMLPLSCTDNGESASPRYTWDYAPHKYWRQGGQYHFRAVYPYDVNVQFGSDGIRFVTTYSMLSENKDILVANVSRDNSEGDDTSPIPLTFKHACAAVRVLFIKGTGDAYRHYNLTGFEMQNLRSVGVLVSEGEDVWYPSEFRTPSVFGWEAASEEDYIAVPDTYNQFKTITTGGWTQWHYVIPQELKADDGLTPALSFSMHVKQYESDGTTLAYETSEPVTTTLPLPLTYTDEQGEHDVVWEPGKIYTYYVQIQPGSASLTVRVTDWERYYVYVSDIVFR